MECVSEIIKDFKHRSNRFLVLFALEYLVDGIQDYVKSEFNTFHEELKQLPKQCLLSCSKNGLCAVCTGRKHYIEAFHRDPRRINWSQIGSSKWLTDPFEVEKCFLPEWCFKSNRSKVSGEEHDDVAVTIGKIMNFKTLYVKFSTAVKPKNIWKIRNQLVNATWISFACKVELCAAIGTFLQTSPIYSDNTLAKTSYNKIEILKEKSYDDITSGKHISKKEINTLHKRVNPKVGRFNIYMYVISILFICIVVITNKAIPNELDATTINRNRYFHSIDSCNLGYGLHFEYYLQQQRHFVGRKWLIDETFHRINVTHAKGVMLIAGPNYGKSAFIADIIKNKDHCRPNGYTIIYHICKRDVKMLQMPDKFVLNLMQRISCSYPRYQKLLGQVDTQWTDIRGVCIYDPYYCLDNFVIHQLNELKSVLGHKLLIIVDGIDQCYSSQMGVQLVSLLQERYTKFPSWVRFLFTTRNDSSILQQFRDLDHLHLFPGESGIIDV